MSFCMMCSMVENYELKTDKLSGIKNSIKNSPCELYTILNVPLQEMNLTKSNFAFFFQIVFFKRNDLEKF